MRLHPVRMPIGDDKKLKILSANDTNWSTRYDIASDEILEEDLGRHS